MYQNEVLQSADYQVNQVFGFPSTEVPDQFRCLGAAPTKSPAIPKIDPDYHFRRGQLREILAFLSNAAGDGLFISGPTGSGKTSGILQTLARLNWPTQQITANGRLELADLIGQYKLVSSGQGQAPTMQFVYGVLPTAMKYGHVLLINELDYADPSVISGLNDIIEGRPLVISETGGEIIEPHPMFRLVATGNSLGRGDECGLYSGIRMQNIAFMDRFRMTLTGYMEKAEEQKLLSKKFQSIPQQLLESVIDVANAIRNQFTGYVNSEGVWQDPTLSTTMSTRTLIRWLNLAVTFRNPSINSMKYGLEHALTNRCDPSEKIAIEKICEHTLGDQWKAGA